MDKAELLAVIGKIRRDARNHSVMDLCDEAERLVLAPPTVARKPRLGQAEVQRNYRLRLKAKRAGAKVVA